MSEGNISEDLRPGDTVYIKAEVVNKWEWESDEDVIVKTRYTLNGEERDYIDAYARHAIFKQEELLNTISYQLKDLSDAAIRFSNGVSSIDLLKNKAKEYTESERLPLSERLAHKSPREIAKILKEAGIKE